MAQNRNQRRPTAQLLLAALLASLSLNALAEVDGARLYRQHCAKCHAEDGRADTWRGYLYFARRLSNPRWQAKASDGAILAAIRKGPGAMPAFAATLDEAEQQALLQAVRGLRQP